MPVASEPLEQNPFNQLPSVAPAQGQSGPIRLLFLIGQLGYGGSERQLYLTLRHLDRNRFETHVVVFNPSPNVVYDQTLIDLGVRVHPVPTAARGICARVRFLYRTLRQVRPELVHSWTTHDNPYAGLVGWLARVPVRWGSVRGSVYSKQGLRLPPLYRWLSLHCVSTLLVNAETLREELLAGGVAPDRIAVLPNCILDEAGEEDGGGADPLRQAGVQDGDRLVGLIGNLRRVKNHLLFVRAVAELLPRFPNLRAVIVGQPIAAEPDYPERLRAEIERLGLHGKVLLIGFRSDVQRLMSRMELVCQTSRSEGMPNTLLEAMAAGRPVVATRVGGTAELVEDGVSGILTEPGDLGSLSAALGRLLEQPELARRMGATARQRAKERHDCGGLARRLEALYLGALERRGAAGGGRIRRGGALA